MSIKSLVPAVLLFTLIAFAAAQQKPVHHKTVSHKTVAHKGAARKNLAHKTAHKTAAGKRLHARIAKKKTAPPATIRRMSRAFVASADLKPMARQLFENRTPAAYAGVESYARRHATDDAGALAWLAVGYARIQDQQYPQAIAALEKARPHAGELRDYVRYLEAVSYGAEGNSLEVVEMLRSFEDEAPESIFLKDAVDAYSGALIALGRTQEAIAYLEQHRTPVRPSVELALGKCYLKTDHPEKGMEILRHLYFTMPTSTEANDAATQLTAAGSALEGSYRDERTRADLLAKAGRWRDAAQAYRQLEGKIPASDEGAIEVAMASVVRHIDPGEARELLDQVQASGEADAERMYLLGETARSENNEGAVAANLDNMRRLSPSSPWFEQALISAANMYLLEKDYDRAIDMFREIQQRFQNSPRASYANWKAAWLTYRQGRYENAKRDFENQIAWYPNRAEVPAALYWRARIAEDEHDYATARAWYTKLGERFRNYYYGYLGRERLAKLPPAAKDVALSQDAILSQIPNVKPEGPEALELEAPPNQLRAEKSRLLLNAGLTDYAIRELQAEQGGQGARWATLQIARIYQENGQTFQALHFLKKALPGYYAVDISALPRPYWEILFPRPYWTDVTRQATANLLDPYLVVSLIRQESEFNPGARSSANAWGLMQLLPQVGHGEARAAHIRHFSTAQLLTPGLNIQLGTRYFRELVSQYNGQVEYALAAYNAGSNRVDSWLQGGQYRDVEEFVESIPFTETREYVQAIVRNAKVYERLYEKPTIGAAVNAQ